MKKRFISLTLICTIIIMSFTACTNQAEHTSEPTTATTTATTTVTTTTQPTQKATTTIPTTTKKNDEVLRNFSSLNFFEGMCNFEDFSFNGEIIYDIYNGDIKGYNTKTKQEFTVVKKGTYSIRNFKIFDHFIVYTFKNGSKYMIFVSDLYTGETKIINNILYEFDYFLYKNYIFICYKYIYNASSNTDPRIYRYDLNAENIEESETLMTKNINSYSHILSGQYLFFNGYEPIEHETPGGEPDSAYLMSLNLKDGTVKKYDKTVKIIKDKDHYIENPEWIIVRKSTDRCAFSTKTGKIVKCPENARKSGIIGDVLICFMKSGDKVQFTNLNTGATYSQEFKCKLSPVALNIYSQFNPNIYTANGVGFYSRMLKFKVTDDKITINAHKVPLKFCEDNSGYESPKIIYGGQESYDGTVLFATDDCVYYTHLGTIMELDITKSSATPKKVFNS